MLFRGVLLTALAGLLVLTGRRPGQRLWTPALCAALAMLVISGRVYLQPVLLSYLFLGMTLWLLERPRLLREVDDPGSVAGEVPNRGIDLSQRDLHSSSVKVRCAGAKSG